MRSQTEWIESLDPWPSDGFGLDRMLALLAELGNPQLRYPAIHVVGTNGKSTTSRMIEALLAAEGLAVGTYLSPHVRAWSERIRIGGAETDFERAVGAVRGAAEQAGATQFEVLTAAALLAFADAEVNAAVVEAGLGGRHDATNVLNTFTVVLTNVALEHTEVLGPTRDAIAREKLAVIRPRSSVVLGEPEWAPLAEEAGAAEVVVAAAGDNVDLATKAAEAFLGYVVDPAPARAVSLPGRLERRADEIRDGAHTPDAVSYIAPHLPPLGAIAASILSDKDVEGILRLLAELTDTFVATTSSNPRALPAEELARRARPWFDRVETEPDPSAAVARAHELGSPVLVTGSLYLLADLSRQEEESVRCRTLLSG